MTDHRNLDDLLRAWADHGDERLPHHNLQAALDRIETTPQRGARWALLEGLIMRLQPAAPILGVAAIAIAAAALYLALGQNIGAPDSTPTPDASADAGTYVSGQYETERFPVPLSMTLAGAASPDGWLVTEETDLIRLDPDPGTGFEVMILPADGLRLVTADGSEPWPADPVERLNQEPDVEAEPMGRPDVDDDLFLEYGDTQVPVITIGFGTGPTGADGLLEGPDGTRIERPPDGTTWWLIDASDADPSLVVIYVAPGDEHGTWFGSVADIVASIEAR